MPKEIPQTSPSGPIEPPLESPPGLPRPEVPPPMHEPGAPPQPQELPGVTPDEVPTPGPIDNPASDDDGGLGNGLDDLPGSEPDVAPPVTEPPTI